MTENKTIKNEQWTVKEVVNKISSGEIEKDKYQRPKRWTTIPSATGDRASVRKFIDFLYENQNSVNAITFGKHQNILSNIDGNNRLNAIVYYLEHPFEVYPEYLDELKRFITDNFPKEIHKELFDIFSKLSYNELIEFKYRNHFNNMGKSELYQKHLLIKRDIFEDFYIGDTLQGIIGFQLKFKVKGTDNFRDTIKINLNIFEGYSRDELNDIYLTVNKYTCSFTEMEILASRLFNISNFVITDNTIKFGIDSAIIILYSERSKGEILKCYKYDTHSIMNAYDFMIGFQNYIHSKYLFVEKVDTNGLTLFFKVWKRLYNGIQDKFTTNNVNDFIEKMTEVMDILDKVYNNIFPPSLKDVLFKRSKKIYTLQKNNLYIIIMAIHGYIKKNVPIPEIVRSIEISILYHFFVKDLSNKDTRDQFKLNDKIMHEAGGSYIDNMADKIYTNPHLINENITNGIMTKLLNVLINENINNTLWEIRYNGKDKKDKRKNRPYHEIILLLNYFKTKVPCEFLSCNFWLEHIIPFSSSWTGEIDSDRFGNTIPIIDTINNKRKTKHISEYIIIENQCNIEFIKFLSDIIPSHENYDKIIDHTKTKPHVINDVEFNRFCDKNEKKYVLQFINYLYN